MREPWEVVQDVASIPPGAMCQHLTSISKGVCRQTVIGTRLRGRELIYFCPVDRPIPGTMWVCKEHLEP
jgi:hypothetical protein